MARIQIRISEDMKHRTAQLFGDLGLDLGTAINFFLSQSLREEEPPFRSRLSQFDREMEEVETSPLIQAGDAVSIWKTSSIMIESEFAYTQKLLFDVKKISKHLFDLSRLYKMFEDAADYKL